MENIEEYDPLGRKVDIWGLQQHPLMPENLGKEDRRHSINANNPLNQFQNFTLKTRVLIGTKILLGEALFIDERVGKSRYRISFSGNMINGSVFLLMAANEAFSADYSNNKLNGQVRYEIGEKYVVEGNFINGVPSGSVSVKTIHNFQWGEVIDEAMETKVNKNEFIEKATTILATYGKNLPVVATQKIKKQMADSGYDVQRDTDLDYLTELYDEFALKYDEFSLNTTADDY
ncbi:MAG: hypothetical protein KAG53_01765 [Endozoicomonadaceae bacterium]|nr:hypothetical protein [Endozoicomonadaceae bacterium]